jgi:hypothetical protein
MDKKKFEKIKQIFKNNINDLERNLENYLLQTREVAKDFGGPSIYFHNKALLEQKNHFLELPHIEMIYAVLPSWGMHKMGDTDTKVIDFDKFFEQIEKNKKYLLELKNKSIHDVDLNELSNFIINKICFTLANSHLVSSSKVIHHILPNLVSPIDRQYSIRFMTQPKDKFTSKTKNGKIKYSSVIYDNDDEVDYASLFISEMHNFIEENKSILIKFIDNDNNMNLNFNTSLTKIFDNLIMIYVKKNEYNGL